MDRCRTGAVAGLVMLIKDVTEQRISERALKESEARFKRIANSAPTMMWVTRLDRVRDFVNDAYVEFVGGPGERPRARPRSSTGARASIPRTSTRIVAASLAGEASGKPFTLEGRYKR